MDIGVAMMRALAHHSWALERMTMDEPVFQQYLFDRSTEFTYEGKMAKFDLVSTMIKGYTRVENPSAALQTLHYRLKQYESEGPFHEKTEAAVALEQGQ
jgi:hypothetical protein